MDLIQKFGQPLDLVNYNDLVFSCKFLSHPPGILAESEVDGVIEEIVDTRVAQRMLDEKSLAGLPRTEEKMRFFLQEPVQIQRTLDDRIGISWEERARKERQLARPLPATEPLLADAPEHVIERRESERMPADNRWGFALDVPDRRYDRGEIHNLTVTRGTLTREERYAINDHIVQTIIMLNNLEALGKPERVGSGGDSISGAVVPPMKIRDFTFSSLSDAV